MAGFKGGGSSSTGTANLGAGPGHLWDPSEVRRSGGRGAMGAQVQRPQAEMLPARISYNPRENIEGPQGYGDQGTMPYVGARVGHSPLAVGCRDPPAVRVKFSGSVEKVALFIGQILNHMDQYGHMYTLQWDHVI